MNNEARIQDEDEHIITNKQQDNAIVAFLCGICIVLAMLLSFLARGCAPDPVVADCLCEQCGEVITDADHGRCQGTEVAACE
jgi:hypothetical protein